MGSPQATSERWLQARALVLEGIEDRIADLRCLEIRKRFTELVVILSLWAAGGVLAVTAVGQVQAGWLRWLTAAVGVLLSAIAINTLVLLLHGVCMAPCSRIRSGIVGYRFCWAPRYSCRLVPIK